MGNTAKQCRLGMFQDSDFAGDLEVPNQLWEEFGVLRKSDICSKKLMCTKQTSVSHRSTESEVFSLDGGLRMDGIPALDLWEVVTEVLHSSNKILARSNPLRD